MKQQVTISLPHPHQWVFTRTHYLNGAHGEKQMVRNVHVCKHCKQWTANLTPDDKITSCDRAAKIHYIELVVIAPRP